MVHIVDRQEMCADGFLGGEVVEVGPRDAQAASFFGPAGRAGAVGFDWREILGVARVFDVEDTSGGYGVAEALDGRVSMSREREGATEEVMGVHVMMYGDSDEAGKCGDESELTAVLVGQTQSNMSAPRATATTMSSGYPWWGSC